MADLPSGTVTLLFTDIEGSTRLLSELGDGYEDVLAEHRQLIRAAVDAHSGQEVDTQGDAFLCAFAAASDAVRAAGDAQLALLATRVRVRMGLHTGEPSLTGEGYVGIDVHRGARVMAAGHGGQVVVSEATAVLLDDELSLTPLGAHRLKDFDEPVRLFQLGDTEFPPLRTIANTNLPTPASSFLGREAELFEADGLLQATRLLTVVGPGGAGKTRFALELARRTREERFADYSDGVVACFLAALRDPTLLLPTLCQTLNIREQPELSALEVLDAHLEGKRMLLVLDNLEHLLAGTSASELSQLLTRAEGLTLLVTSRELLRIGGETDYQLPPLRDDEGVELFCERARLEPTVAMGDLCRRLDGLPLAIELAAARTRLLTPEQLLDRLGQRLDLLKAGRDADPRQQTLRATIEWSYDLLTEAEQTLFANLAVFVGGCALDAAEDVARADLDLLESLLDKSLVRHTGDRFWMLETIREFAVERLEESGRGPDLNQRHAQHFATLVEAAEPHLFGRDQDTWTELLDVEHDNIRAALRWSARNDADFGLRIVGHINRYWYSGDHWREAQRWFATFEAKRPARSPLVDVRVLDGLAMFSALAGDRERAVARSDESLAAARSLGDPERISQSLVVRQMVFGFAGDMEAYELAAREAIDFARAAGDQLTVGVTLANLSDLSLRRGCFEEAKRLGEEAFAVLIEIGDAFDANLALINAAFAALELGGGAGARSALQQTLTAANGQGSADRTIHSLVGLIAVDALEGKHDRAARLAGAVRRQLEERDHELEGYEGERHRRTLAELESALGADMLRDRLDLGAGMDLDATIDYALAETTER